jgi:hypothetical protein
VADEGGAIFRSGRTKSTAFVFAVDFFVAARWREAITGRSLVQIQPPQPAKQFTER